MNDDIVEDLQTRLAYQEDTLNKLNDLVVLQTRELADVKKQLALVYKKMSDMSYQLESQQDGGVDSEVPPHY
ncbi:SlyX family protein [Saccharophagus degradans]|uniref:SlyX family protein n=1 Tax=Saccharophagus degradans TaxID=86304 RepID=A0AAW7X345_9GAMM|nr:SlyX family protein [Saccharophagus degradans]MBU2986002.1 SlyX family protein [Saccharophagus degradans]MDO6421982.1 SlyX family protein [Saccharophagus degradans]MDO6606325.1 SlyX family protein [Saccharophagus degradans]WGO97204.1 SlyX family protein [Saccharophagus degradans]